MNSTDSSAPNTIKQKALLLVFWISVVSYILGVALPLFTLQKFFVFEESFSIVEGIWKLSLADEYSLALILFTFSVLTPTIKLGSTFLALNAPSSTAQQLKHAKRLLMIGKWSMADVFVIAIIAATIKFDGMATVTVHIGIIFFAASVILSTLLSHVVLHQYELTPKHSA